MTDRKTETIDLGGGCSAVIYAQWLAGEEDDYADWLSAHIQVGEDGEPKGLPPTGAMARELVRLMLVSYITPEGAQKPTEPTLRGMPVEHREALTEAVNARRPLRRGPGRGKT